MATKELRRAAAPSLSEKYSDTPTEVRSIRAYILGNAIQRLVYRKAGYSKKFYNEHEREILICKAAKKAFDNYHQQSTAALILRRFSILPVMRTAK